ncbi:MAG: hypothetical protein ABS52_16595 [Gemmatimonadetes bacterium SCN 70-22]|nr:MAG: hypothetical protein ABS52_16595 [Gemmatimonadetes bacterium SCN 70-22]
MKALSVQQPWAWLIVNGHKDIENRDWWTKRRGERVLIHAGRKFDDEGLAWVRQQFPHIALPPTFESGGIVGEVTVTGCVTQSASPWFVGRYGFTLANATPVPFYPVRGQLGFFDVPEYRQEGTR